MFKRLFPPFFITLTALCLLSTALYGQTPVLLAVVNPASNTPTGLPNYGIAQGSIFVVYGQNMGPASLAQASSLPLPTNAGLAGTSIQVRVNGTLLTAPVVYTSSTQVAGVLPSNIPVGSGDIEVTYNGNTGYLPLTVVASNFGISTLNETGGGPAVVTRPDYSVITATDSAKPGETLVLWGTGLGPTSGDDAGVPVSKDLGTPIQLLVGGQTANVLYRGRSAFPGLDQINFTMPTNVSGCYVSIAVQTGNTVSNFTTIPVAANGGACSDLTGLSVSNLGGALSGGSVRLGGIFLSQVTATNPGSGPSAPTTSGYASFYKFTSSQLIHAASFTGRPSVGGCLVSPGKASGGSSGNTFDATQLDAGTISLSGADSSGNSLVTNGNGGADVKAFTTTVNVGALLTWTNESSINTIDRTQPFQVTWNGGNPNGFVEITGYAASITGTGSVLSASFSCTAPTSAGSFTIPAAVLLSLPPSTVNQQAGFSYSTGYMSVGSYSNPTPFSAPGLDYAYTIAGNSASTVVTYK